MRGDERWDDWMWRRVKFGTEASEKPGELTFYALGAKMSCSTLGCQSGLMGRIANPQQQCFVGSNPTPSCSNSPLS
jgi:hypothetical protein